MTNFNVGDKVKIKRLISIDGSTQTDSYGVVGQVYTIGSVSNGDPHYKYSLEDCPVTGKFRAEELELAMDNIRTKAKKVLMSKEDRALYNCGLIDIDGDLTGDGEELLFSILLSEYKAKMVELANKISDDEKAEKSKK